jgi:hypothetical protein
MRGRSAPVAIAVALLTSSAAFAGADTYDVGPLAFHGTGVFAAPDYAIGVLAYRGSGAATPPAYAVSTLAYRGIGATTPSVYTVGTLSYSGEGPAKEYAVGTLVFHPKKKLGKPTTGAAKIAKGKPQTPPSTTEQDPLGPLIDLGKLLGALPRPTQNAAGANSSSSAASSPSALGKINQHLIPIPTKDQPSTLH